MDLMNSVTIIAIILFTILVLATNSYAALGFLALAMLAIAGDAQAGFLGYVATIIYLLIIGRFVRKKKRYLREHKRLYNEGRRRAHWAKSYKRGYNDEYYDN